MHSHIRASQLDSRYFETSDGAPYIPIGLNLCFPRGSTDVAEGLARYSRWITNLSSNGGNFMRLWLGAPFFDLESTRCGQFDEVKARLLDEVLALAQQHGIRVKLTLDHFRFIETESVAENFPGVASFAKSIYHPNAGGDASNMDEFLQSDACRARYLKRIDWLAHRYGRHSAIFGWELWNEMNAVRSKHWLQWTREVLPEVHRRLPAHLVMQSMGSFDCEWARACYTDYSTLADNDVLQVHSYLDLGAEFPFCHGPVDMICANAVYQLREFSPTKPVLLAECGAVLPKHAGPSDLYARDSQGAILHDSLFAPFFAGAAGGGQSWHWDFYVDRHSLWWHYARFHRAIGGLDPRHARLEPVSWTTPELRVYALSGRHTSLLWLRDRHNDWKSELVEGVPPRELPASTFPLPESFGPIRSFQCYDPWRDNLYSESETGAPLTLPSFRRSLVITVKHAP